MSIALIVAALLSPPSAAPATPPRRDSEADRSLSDSDRLTELRMDVDSALAAGRIDGPTAARLYLAIERVRRQMFVMGMQFGYRQKVRLRARIDRLYAELARREAATAAEIRSGN